MRIILSATINHNITIIIYFILFYSTYEIQVQIINLICLLDLIKGFMSATNQKRIKFAEKVLAVFSQAQKAASIHKTRIFQLVKYSQEDTQLFKYSFEQAYLKIFHSFHLKTNKKIPNKFETLAQSFFEAILPKLNQNEGVSNSNIRWSQLFNAFLCLCSEGVYSSIMNIRIMCARLLFLLVKLIPPKKMEIYLQDQTQSGIMNSILYLLRTKVSTYRQLGIKLSSLVIHLQGEKIHAIERQLFKIVAVEQNQQIRKLVITNLTITRDNLDEILVRLRDKNPQIRIIVAKKLQGEKFKLHNMNITHLYKLLYDGYGSKEILVKKECLRYFSMYFLDNQPSGNTMDVENKQRQFVNIFKPEILLLNPHMYSLFDELIADLLMEIQAHMADYLRNACVDIKTNILSNEIIWIKNSANSQSRQIARIYEELGPSGMDLSSILKNLVCKNEIFAIYELLQLFTRQNLPDEIGRNKMFDALKTLLINLKHTKTVLNYESLIDSDICYRLTEQQITRKRLMLSYYDMPIISSSFDLIHQIGIAMKKLRPQHYENEMKQIMAEWNNPQQNVLRKEKELVQMNLQRLRLSGDQKIHNNMKAKHEAIQNQIQQQNEKTLKVLMCISRLRYNCNLESFMSIIKEQLTKEDKANGLLLLGLYCLQSKDKVNTFWHIFWNYIQEDNPTQGVNKNHLLVSLKIIIDFIVKFNTLSGPFQPQEMENFSADSFLHQMLILLLHEDPDIRILAIQSLCRLLYHERIDKDNESIYFFYIFLLWLQAPTNGISAKAVHTVSIFIKNYLEKGNRYSLKFAQVACLFLKILVKYYGQDKCINKQMIKYNLTMQQFFKKVTYMLMTICKYHKQNRSVIWFYSQQQSQLGPQQFLLIYMLQQDKIVPMLGKALSQCDFYQFCSLQVLIMVKKIVEKIVESRKWKGVIESSLKKLQSEIQINISSKNSQMFNDPAVQAMQGQFSQKMQLLNEQSKYITKNIEDLGLFVRINEEDDEDEPDQDDDLQQGNEDCDDQQQQNCHEVASCRDSQSIAEPVSRKRVAIMDSYSDESSQKQNSEVKKTKKSEERGNKRQKAVSKKIINLRSRKV